VYLLHGYPYDQTHWLDLDLIKAYEQELAGGKLPHVVFVFPFVPEPLFTKTDGGVGSYEQEFMEGLVPAVTTAFRIASAVDMHGIGGVSRGGVWALEIGLIHSDHFGHIFAISPSLVNNYPRPSYDPFEIIHEDRIFPETLFLSTAENEAPFRGKIEAFVAELEQENIQHTFLLHPGAHNDASWRSVISELLIHVVSVFSPGQS
jgi:enterochelin esterase-like enzyme